MRHVSKTRRVAPDWLFDRINLEPKIQIKFVDTKNQLADGQGDGVPKAGLQQAAADPRGSSRTCVCANTLVTGVAHAGEVKGELSSCPWYRLVGVAKTSSETQRRVDRAARKCEWSPRGTGTTALTYPCPSQPCFGGSKGCAQVTGKAGDNGQNSGDGAARSSWTRPSAPGCGDTLKALASYGSIQGGHQSNLAPGSLSTGSPAGRDSSATKARRRLTVQAYVRTRKLCWFERGCP